MFPECHHPLPKLQTPALDRELDPVQRAEDLESINDIPYGVAKMTGFILVYDLVRASRGRYSETRWACSSIFDKCFWWRVVNLKRDTIVGHVEREQLPQLKSSLLFSCVRDLVMCLYFQLIWDNTGLERYSLREL